MYPTTNGLPSICIPLLMYGVEKRLDRGRSGRFELNQGIITPTIFFDDTVILGKYRKRLAESRGSAKGYDAEKALVIESIRRTRFKK